MISVCIVAKNEEKYIEDCINSVKNFASEIIVVDNGSTDNTVKISKNMGCIIIDAPHCVLDEAKKMYFNKAKYPWIFTLDADERCDYVNKNELYEFLEKTPADIWAYSIKEYQYIGRGKWSEISLVRLFRNNGLIKFNNSEIHASLIPSIITNGGKIKDVNIYAHHLDILIPNRTKNKRDKYRKLLINKLNDKDFINSDSSSEELYKIFLSMEFTAIKDFSKSKDLLLDVIEHGKYYRDFAIITLCRIFLITDELENILQYIDINILNNIQFDKPFGESNDIIDLLCNYLYYYDKNRLITIYDKLINSANVRVSDYINYAFILKSIDFKKGKNIMKKAINLNPYICKKLIYIEGEKPNLFDQQSNFLKPIESVEDIMEFYNLKYLIQ